ncbi:PAS domain-containing methyl-accepting chemotaxis protein, partial [Bacteriovoracaceae bacterium]|nr:PAS domain-containing methyl-accepting chemotaxis protein [Bacteriovoracaceae bacterium]
KSQAVIEFTPQGEILVANENFLAGLGYELSEIKGNHHRMFCEEEYVNSLDYKNFWRGLASGEFSAGEYKRIKKNGEPIWINASYNPILDAEGNVFKVVKFASDVTEAKIKNSDYESKINAIDKSQAVIEFTPDGTIITANQNFLSTTGYKLNEIEGKHHQMFCEKSYTKSSEYRSFWNKLGKGQFDAGEYKRISKEGNEIWINASYNPLYDLDGKVYKVVKYATDLTKEKQAYNNLVFTFDKAANEVLATAEDLSASATQLSQNAQNTLEGSNSASSAVEEVHVGIQTVGTSTEEMEASIKEISVSSSDASTMSKQAKEKSNEANKTINHLGEASEEIGNVLKVISSIAQQTNLLALNATIEAARAGEAGRGFSVVANEVKELAKQTAQATEDISSKIHNVQSSTGDAVSAITEVSDFIDKLNEIAISTAAAVEEQAATTSEVSRVIMDSNTSISSVAETIKDVSIAAEENSKSSNKTLNVAKNLRDLSENLKVLVAEAKKD